MNIHAINLILESLNDYLPNSRKRITSKRNESEFRVRQIYEAKVNINPLAQNVNNFLSELCGDECIELSLNDKKIIDKSEMDTCVKNSLEASEEFLKVKISFLQKIPLPLLSDKIEFFVCDVFDVEEFLKHVITGLQVKDIKDCLYKINIFSKYYNQNNVSSLFNFIKKNYSCLQNTNIVFEDYIIGIINKEKYEKRPLTLIPNALTHDLISSEQLKKSMYKDTLSLMFNYSNENEVHLYNKNILNISFQDVKVNFFDSYYAMCKVILFIYQDKKYIKEKLLISQNLIYEVLSENIDICFDINFWKEIKKNIDHEYKIFVDDKVDSFIKEKKEVIKDQFSLSTQIINQISDLKKGLINNLMTIIGIFMSKFFIDALGKSDYLFTSIAIYISTVFSFYLLISFYISGDSKIEKKYENRIKIMNNYYPKLFLTKDNLLSELDEMIISPEIIDLRKVKRLCLIIYWLMFLSFSIISLFRIGILVCVNF